ncbi:MAG: DUF4129 domain-containing protein [Acidobacteria bacterium]|nr:DUF4129 domain-containing protein [Acidobacteriota bacterium]
MTRRRGRASGQRLPRAAAALLAVTWIAGPARPALAARPAMAAAAVAIAAAAGAAPTISTADYRESLLDVQAALGRGDWEAARARARSLEDRRIAWGGEELAADRSVLGPLAAAKDRAAAGKAALPLAQLIRALSAGAAGPSGAAGAAGARGGGVAAGAGTPAPTLADPALLERLRRSQALAEIAAGGNLPDPRLDGGGLLAALRDFLRPAARVFKRWWDAIGDRLGRWLRSLLARGPERRPAFGLRGVAVLAVILALAMLWLAVQAARRRQRRGALEVPAAMSLPSPARDDDPLSRAAGQWETYARELAAAGRFREAVRAWYHAVLVTLYQGGILQFRKGRTNWEYVSTVPPSNSWRPALVEMTRRFEREWYGRDRSSPEALAASQDLARHLLDALRSSPP